MDLFKRITNLLTPPPEKVSASAHNSTIQSTENETSVLTANLGQTLKSLVSAPSLDHPQAAEAISTLKRIAATSGLYVVASKMRYQLDAMPRVLPNGAVNWKDRGYLLAADFIYEHILRDIRSVEAMNRPVGPNIFRTTCNELVACLQYAKNARRVIELPVVLVEDLLQLAVTSPIWRDLYLELADVVATSSVTQAAAKLETDRRCRNRQRQEEKNGEVLTAPPVDPLSQLDSDAVLYAKRLQDQIVCIRRELTTIPPVPAAGGQAPPEALRAFAEYLHALMTVASRASYTAFTAYLQSNLGGLIARANPQSAAAYYQEAAERFVALANEECDLKFSKLSARHFARAAELFSALGDQTTAQQYRARAAGAQ